MSDDLSAVPAAARGLGRDWVGLAGGTSEHERFTTDSLVDLPEPARRWLRHAVVPGTPLWSSVVLTMRGQIRLGRWRSFTGSEVLAPPRGFIWSARARVVGLPVTGFDRHSSGAGQMRWSLLGVLPVMRVSGPDVTRSAAGRLAGEALLWLPTAFPSAIWSSGHDPDTAVATWRIGDHDEASRVRVDATGRLAEFGMHRWGDPDRKGYERRPFGGVVEAERAFGGVTIASRIRAGWWWGTERQDEGEFFRAEITDAVFR